ncbi:16S rRNA (cytosine(1402)-N(4))-methyltransferase [bacterium SCN 62-11]|nr:16S rRNA (cytosine(1402)-N(4))-methyltransferase RsmH [Candidatus Eremiobacteraeota bacterium]ODT62979.1 MAG: 16S rRNA (cytosine(1402)-N(4))-methyltransferase [bacterium SCN 62-11]
MEETPAPHKRRPRYRGTNPRRFEERYKEHDPERYGATVERVIAKGQTPAGMHLPICVQEILEALDPKPGEIGLDCTLGYAGHSSLLMPRLLPGGMLFAVDVDPIELPRSTQRMRDQGYDEVTFISRQQNFAAIRGLLGEAGGGFDVVLADLGVSSMQLDNPARGFTYKADGPLDLRLNPEKGRPASELLKAVTLPRLEKILSEYADEPYAKDIARAILRSPNPPSTTAQLTKLVRSGLGNLEEKHVKKSLARTFMALRIAVNEELSVLDHFLEVLPYCLKPGGRVAILSFHSGEDRRVKRAFAIGLEEAVYETISPAPILAGEAERRANPRSIPAKLRWAVRSTKPLG